MALSGGTLLGPYEIVAPIGEGGMGEVYRARDPRLGREVAIKVSAAQFTERFEREARAVAALNHPNICTLYDVGPNYLVMELIEGVAPAGPLPFDTALNYARQIANALEAAHEKGIVHRDLKPANIKVKPDGTVKVLDFGLAKMAEPVSGSRNPQNSPTLTISATQAGMILGTASYMSPEQARGDPVDQRADIWAFGVVLYEMLVGRKMFEARTVSDTLAAVLVKEPDLNLVAAQVRPLLRRCLAKEPHDRLHHIADARLMLDEAPEGAPVPAAKPRTGAAWWIATAVLALALTAVGFVHFREQPPRTEVMHFQISPPAGKSLYGPDAAISPDGRRLAVQLMGPDGRSQMWIRNLDSPEWRPLAGTEGASYGMIWSPDSRFLAFAQPGWLKKINADGSAPQTLCDIPPGGGPQGAWRAGAWSPKGFILYGLAGSGVWKVSDSGGVPSEVTTLDRGQRELFHSAFALLPDGTRFLYRRNRSSETGDIHVGSADAKPEHQTLKPFLAADAAMYVPAAAGLSKEHLVFARQGTLVAQAFDTGREQLTGEPFQIADGMGRGTSARAFSASATGILAYRTGTGGMLGANSSLLWFDREGKYLATVGEPGIYNTVALSRDGTRAAASRTSFEFAGVASGRGDLWAFEFARGTSTRLTFDPGQDWLATWSPDGSQIIFSSVRDGGQDLYRKSSSGAGNDELLLKSDEDKSAQDWSRDGRFLLYTIAPKGRGGDRTAPLDLWVLPLTGDRKPEPYIKTEFSEGQGRFSPDGRYVAYRSDASGADEIYVQPFPNPAGGKWTISQGGGGSPVWRADGKELYYIGPESKLMAVEVSTSPTFRAGIPKVLFQTTIVQSGGGLSRNVTRYDASPDGKKFLINSLPAAATGPSAAPITVLVNWTSLLKK